jgi:predicted  nucleic acid-binding Zn-ribbon protein
MKYGMKDGTNMSKELQRAQDMLTAIQGQRDNALNAMVIAQAEIAEARRTISDMDKELTEVRAQLAASQAAYIEITKPSTGNEQTLNGGVDSSRVGDTEIGVPTI